MTKVESRADVTAVGGDKQLRSFSMSESFNEPFHIGMAQMVFRLFKQQDMQAALSFVLAQRELGLDEALFTFAPILDGDSFLGNN
ncbi:hypothetical protein D3C87_1326590 [compost metagenome]